MKEIIYNNVSKEIQFSGYISSFIFYNQYFNALEEHYNANGEKATPTFSFILVDCFESLVLPNIFLAGLNLKRKHLCKIPLKIINTSATKFLESTLFFDNVGINKNIGEEFNVDNQRTLIEKNVGLDIFDYDIGQLGFYNNENIQKSFNPIHKINVFQNCSQDYYSNYLDETISKERLESLLDTIRTKVSNNMKFKIAQYFYEILKYSYRKDDSNVINILERKHIEHILEILTEIICNSILYSYSYCVTMLQSRNGKTEISISDGGIGFEGSFYKKPNFDNFVSKNFQTEYKEKLKNYLLIFDALHYSKNKDRYNLYSVLDLIIELGGKMRIHYNDVQVVFTSSRCKNCKKFEPINCAQCLLNNLSDDKLISPIRFYNNTFEGVHIEIELIY